MKKMIFMLTALFCVIVVFASCSGEKDRSAASERSVMPDASQQMENERSEWEDLQRKAGREQEKEEHAVQDALEQESMEKQEREKAEQAVQDPSVMESR